MSLDYISENNSSTITGAGILSPIYSHILAASIIEK